MSLQFIDGVMHGWPWAVRIFPVQKVPAEVEVDGMRTSRFAPILVAGALAATSCGTELASDVTTTLPDDSVVVASTLVDNTSAAAPLPARLRLTDLGAVDGPSIVLTGQVPNEAAWNGTMTSRFDVAVDGIDLAPTPTFELGMETTVEKTAEDRWTYSTRYTSVTLAESNGADQATIEDSLELLGSLSGLEIRADVDQFGLTSNTALSGLEDLDPMLRSLLEPMADQADDMTVPVPSGPLGIGATWSDTLTLDLLGVTTTTEVTYVLTEIDGTRYTLESSTTQTQSGPGIVSSTATGSGIIHGDVTEPLPLMSEARMTSTTVQAFGAGEQTIAMEFSILISGS